MNSVPGLLLANLTYLVSYESKVVDQAVRSILLQKRCLLDKQVCLAEKRDFLRKNTMLCLFHKTSLRRKKNSRNTSYLNKFKLYHIQPFTFFVFSLFFFYFLIFYQQHRMVHSLKPAYWSTPGKRFFLDCSHFKLLSNMGSEWLDKKHSFLNVY